MNPMRTVWGALLAALVCLAGGVLLSPRGTAPAKLSAPSVGSEDAPELLGRARQAERYARWVLLSAPGDIEELGRARRACRGALEGIGRGGDNDALLTVSLKEVRIDLEARIHRAIQELWVDYRRHYALREWDRARAALSKIARATNDPTDPDYRSARRYLDRLAGR